VKTLPTPDLSVGDVVDLFTHGPKVNTVHANRAQLIAVETTYAALAAAEDLVSMIAPTIEISADDAKVVSWAYEAHFRDKQGGGRHVYTMLKGSAKVCPLCRTRDVSELDHHLPRDSHPALGIQPTNLVPVCSVCNYSKLQSVASSAADQYLHPYFDDLQGDAWLKATVVKTPGGPVVYSVAPQPGWSSLLALRVEWHLEHFGLSRHYGDKATTRIGGHRKMFSRILADEGPESISDFLFELADSVRADENEPWIAAALDAWAASQWFCSGGFKVDS
jgi:hypothetical protein